MVADTICNVHPRPFRNIDINVFDRTYEALLIDVPELSDKEIDDREANFPDFSAGRIRVYKFAIVAIVSRRGGTSEVTGRRYVLHRIL